MADLNDSTDGRAERAKDAALGKHDSNPSHVDEAGEAAGGIGGVLAGAAIGSVAGPVGTLIGGIAGAMGGWWSGRAVTEAASKLTDADGELQETQHWLMRARDYGYINTATFDSCWQQAQQVGRRLGAMMNSGNWS